MPGARADLEAAVVAEIPLFVSATALLQVAVADQLGVPVSDLHCLNLVESGLASTPTRLAELMGMTTGAVTKMLDRMEQHRLVRREPDPADRRRLIVRATGERAAEIAGLYAPMGHHLAEWVGRGSDEQLRFLGEFTTASRAAAVDETRRLRREGKAHATRRPRSG